MGYAQKLPARVSAADYLLLDERSLEKLEFLDGVVYEWQKGAPYGMAGSSKRHNRTSLNIWSVLQSQLKAGPCSAYVAEVKVAAADDSAFFYPDVVVTCSESDRDSELLIREPLLVVEVLSDSTELFDRRLKFEAYQRCASLASYVLVSPKFHMIEVFTKAGNWSRTAQTEGPHPRFSEVIDLGTHGLTLPARDVFEGVRFGEGA